MRGRAGEGMEVLRELRARRGMTQRSESGVVFLSAVRTPFGTFGGTLKDMPVTELTTYAAKAAIERASIDPQDIDSSIFGCVLYTAPDSVYFSRHVGLRAGLREESSALTVNRLCGSGFQA